MIASAPTSRRQRTKPDRASATAQGDPNEPASRGHSTWGYEQPGHLPRSPGGGPLAGGIGREERGQARTQTIEVPQVRGHDSANGRGASRAAR